MGRLLKHPEIKTGSYQNIIDSIINKIYEEPKIESKILNKINTNIRF